jgi:hypothetical protein
MNNKYVELGNHFNYVGCNISVFENKYLQVTLSKYITFLGQ